MERIMNVYKLAEQINDAAFAFQVGKLQEFRAKLHGWKKPRTYKIQRGHHSWY